MRLDKPEFYEPLRNFFYTNKNWVNPQNNCVINDLRKEKINKKEFFVITPLD